MPRHPIPQFLGYEPYTTASLINLLKQEVIEVESPRTQPHGNVHRVLRLAFKFGLNPKDLPEAIWPHELRRMIGAGFAVNLVLPSAPSTPDSLRLRDLATRINVPGDRSWVGAELRALATEIEGR